MKLHDKYYGRKQIYVDWNWVLAWVVILTWIVIVTWGAAKEITSDEKNMRKHDIRVVPEHPIPTWR